MGDKVTKNIGPAGGTLASPDGRLTLTVPEDALTETLPFAIQPVTNKLRLGLGLAYRLEPDGKTFTTPLEISFHYDDHDLEGTIPEALAIGYQDNAGAWHMQTAIAMDKDKKTITLSATHFSDYTLDAILGLSPSKATVRVGESVTLVATHCEAFTFDFIHRLFAKKDCKPEYVYDEYDSFELRGEGKLKAAGGGALIYTAPGKKPTPNIARVIFTAKEFDVHIRIPVDCPGRLFNVPGPESAEAEITIVDDQGYRASGKAGTTVFSGDICDLGKKFSLKTNNPFLSSFEFEPDKNSPTKGKWSFSTQNGVTGGGSGRYTITGTDALKTGIEMDGFSTGRGLVGPTLSGGGPMHLDLVPLEKCGN